MPAGHRGQALPEDIEPNLDFELQRFLAREGRNVTFNREGRERYFAFAMGPQALWSVNFRDLLASVTRMATLAPQGRITVEVVEEEVARLRVSWSRLSGGEGAHGPMLHDVLGRQAADRLDRFDAVQLAEVLRVCRGHASLSEADRALFAQSRPEKKSSNDADRLSKYLARFGLRFEDVKSR